MKSNLSVVAILICLVLPCVCAVGQEADLSEADSDGDGKVTVAEFQKYADGRLQGFDQIEAFAKAVDTDGDDEISEEEFAKRISVLRKIRLTGGMDEKSDSKNDANPKDLKSNDTNALPAKAAFAKLKKLIAESKWKEASQMMTKDGRDELVVQQLVSSIGLTKLEMPMPMPQLDETIDDINEILIEYGLDDLDLDLSHMFRVEMSMGEDEGNHEEESQDSDGGKDSNDAAGPKNKMEDIGKKILTAVEKSGKRWEIVGDLWDAKKSSPFSMSPLAGKIGKHELMDEVAYLVVTPASASTDGDQGITIQMVVPPSVVRMKKIGDDWKYDGPDPERTNKAMKEFMEKSKGRFGTPPARNDF